jgi:translation initiation factor 1 (eIF-1/SUI1)
MVWNKGDLSKSHFLVTLKNGTRINGTVESAESGKKIMINGDDGSKIETTLEEMVFLKGLKSDFWSRAHASLDIGISLLKQIT